MRAFVASGKGRVERRLARTPFDLARSSHRYPEGTRVRAARRSRGQLDAGHDGRRRGRAFAPSGRTVDGRASRSPADARGRRAPRASRRAMSGAARRTVRCSTRSRRGAATPCPRARRPPPERMVADASPRAAALAREVELALTVRDPVRGRRARSWSAVRTASAGTEARRWRCAGATSAARAPSTDGSRCPRVGCRPTRCISSSCASSCCALCAEPAPAPARAP